MRPHLRELTEWLAEQGATGIELEHGRHVRIWYEWKGRRRFYLTAATPSDRRSTLRALADLRHILGLVEDTKRVGAKRKHRQRNRCEAPPEPTSFTPGRDWAADLRRHPGYGAALHAQADAAFLGLWREAMARIGARSRL